MEYFTDEEFNSAACKSVGTEPFFMEDKDDIHHIRALKEVCKVCPITNRCLEIALINEEEFGVWGGLTSYERMLLRRRGTMRARVKEQAITLPATIKQIPTKPVPQAKLENLLARNAERAETSGNRISAVLKKALELHLDKLPEITVELIKLRIANPSLSITDLGQMMHPKMNKAQVSGRLRRAAELVN